MYLTLSSRNIISELSDPFHPLFLPTRALPLHLLLLLTQPLSWHPSLFLVSLFFNWMFQTLSGNALYIIPNWLQYWKSKMFVDYANMTIAGNSNIKATSIFLLQFVVNLSARSVVKKLWEDLYIILYLYTVSVATPVNSIKRLER